MPKAKQQQSSVKELRPVASVHEKESDERILVKKLEEAGMRLVETFEIQGLRAIALDQEGRPILAEFSSDDEIEIEELDSSRALQAYGWLSAFSSEGLDGEARCEFFTSLARGVAERTPATGGDLRSQLETIAKFSSDKPITIPLDITLIDAVWRDIAAAAANHGKTVEEIISDALENSDEICTKSSG